MLRFTHFFILWVLCVSFPLRAEIQWMESPLWRGASVLPPGQHRWSGRAGGQIINQRFDNEGAPIALGANYAQKWSWGDLLKTQNDKVSPSELRQYMDQNNISENDHAATSGFDIERDELNFDVSWAYGMTSRWMFGLFIPVSQVTTRVTSRVNVESDSNTSLSVFSEKQGKSMEEVKTMVGELVRSELESRGFKSIPTERTQWIWGDISLLNQYLVHDGEDTRWSFQNVLRMPTSRNPSLSDFALSSRDEGQIDVGISQFLEKRFGSFLGIVSARYTHQLPGPIRVAERDEFGNRLSGHREVERKLGDLWWGGLETRYDLSGWWRVSGAYRYFYKEPDVLHFADPVRGADQEAHLARFVGSYIFSEGESRYGIEKKWMINFQLQSTLAGTNTDQLTSAAVEIQTYF